MTTFSIHASGFTLRLRTRFALVACTLVVTTISTNASIAAPAAVRGYGDLPMAFEHNAGQAESSALFLARGRGYALSLMADGAVLTLQKSKTGDLRTASEPGEDADPISAHVRMRLAGASQSAKVRGLDLLPGVSHYFVGSDPEHWRTGIANFARVSYENIYPGVDLVYYGNQRELEYDFIVAPKADPGAIRLSFEGVKKLLLDSDGNLLILTALGEIKQHKPVIYQVAQGVRQPIAGGYRIDGHNAKFWIGEYDATQALVIDPVLSYSTYLGGSSADESNAITVEAAGAAYITGDTISNNFPTVPTASFPPTAYSLVFVSKLNPAGNALAYSVFLGGSGAANNVGYGIAWTGRATLMWRV